MSESKNLSCIFLSGLVFSNSNSQAKGLSTQCLGAQNFATGVSINLHHQGSRLVKGLWSCVRLCGSTFETQILPRGPPSLGPSERP